jgi:thioesterase domain-containing protein
MIFLEKRARECGGHCDTGGCRKCFEMCATASERYVLKPYPGRATLIRAAEKSLRSADDPHAAWLGLVGTLEICQIPGDHYDMLVPPQVDLLADCLKTCIDKARSESFATLKTF